MTDDKRPPCFDRLDAECFEKEPEWAKQAFAYRLLRLLLPEQITKRLPTSLREALVAPGVIIPPGVELPPGAVFPPGSVIPPGWTPGDPLPLGVQTPPVLPAAAAATGPAPPSYVAPAASEPTSQPGRAAPPAEPETLTITANDSDGYIWERDLSWAQARDGDTDYDPVDYESHYSAAIRCDLFNNYFLCRRTYLTFNIPSALAGTTFISVTVSVIGASNADDIVSIQESAHHEPLEKADFQTMPDNFFGNLYWQVKVGANYNPNLFTLNAAGMAYVEAQIGSTAKFCLRDYTQDYLGAQPPEGLSLNGVYFADHATEEYRPHIIIVYQ